eukprot:465074-Hanusia_phi.AAC.1
MRAMLEEVGLERLDAAVDQLCSSHERVVLGKPLEDVPAGEDAKEHVAGKRLERAGGAVAVLQHLVQEQLLVLKHARLAVAVRVDKLQLLHRRRRSSHDVHSSCLQDRRVDEAPPVAVLREERDLVPLPHPQPLQVPGHARDRSCRLAVRHVVAEAMEGVRECDVVGEQPRHLLPQAVHVPQSPCKLVRVQPAVRVKQLGQVLPAERQVQSNASARLLGVQLGGSRRVLLERPDHAQGLELPALCDLGGSRGRMGMHEGGGEGRVTGGVTPRCCESLKAIDL